MHKIVPGTISLFVFGSLFKVLSLSRSNSKIRIFDDGDLAIKIGQPLNADESISSRFSEDQLISLMHESLILTIW